MTSGTKILGDPTIQVSLDQTINANQQATLTIKSFDEERPITDHKHQNELSLTFGASMFNTLPTSDSLSREETRLGDDSRFEIRSILGEGSFGEVFSAQDRDLNRLVALKQFRGDPTLTLNACRDELKFLGRLEHPNIPTIYQASLTAEGNPYIVMKQLEGESLKEIITRMRANDEKTHSEYSFRQRIDLIIQLLRVLEYAHQARVLHRDIKPENIYIGEQKELYLIDWGIAEDFDIARANPVLCGTPLYLSPEQSRADPLGPESDIYSVGAVAYELMSLKSCAPPFQTLDELIEKLPTYIPKMVDLHFNSIQGYVPSEFKSTIMRAIARDPAKRYSSAAEMAHDLDQALDGYFKVVCPRTLIKFYTFKFSKWLDKRLKNIMIVYLAILAFVSALIGLGVLIGYWFAS